MLEHDHRELLNLLSRTVNDRAAAGGTPLTLRLNVGNKPRNQRDGLDRHCVGAPRGVAFSARMPF